MAEPQGKPQVARGDWTVNVWQGTVALANDDHQTIYQLFKEQLDDDADNYTLVGFNLWAYRGRPLTLTFLAWPNQQNKTINDAFKLGRLEVEAFTTNLDYADGFKLLTDHFEQINIHAERIIADFGDAGPQSETRFLLGESYGNTLHITNQTDLDERRRLNPP